MTKPEMKKVTEFEDDKGKRWRKTTHAESKAYVGAVHRTYESAPGRLSFGDFVPVGEVPKVEPVPKLPA